MGYFCEQKLFATKQTFTCTHKICIPMNVGFCSQECFDHFHQCFKIKNKTKTREYIQNNIYFWPEGSIRAKTISLKHFKSIPEEFFTEYPKLKRF